MQDLGLKASQVGSDTRFEELIALYLRWWYNNPAVPPHVLKLLFFVIGLLDFNLVVD
jgi:hypothetical protein